MPLFGPPNIAKLKETGNIDALRKAIDHRRHDIRQEAALALLDLQGSGALSAVLPLLNDDDRELRLTMLKAIADYDDQRARVALMKMLADEDQTIRVAAAQLLETRAGLWMTTLAIQLAPDLTDRMLTELATILSKLDREATIAHLHPHAADKERNVRVLVSETLDALGWEPATDDPIGADYWVERRQWERCIDIGLPAAPALVKALVKHVSDIDVRVDILHVLDEIGWMPGQDGTAALYLLVTWQWQRIADIGAPAVPPLLEVLDHPHSLVREHAVLALGQIGDQRAVPPLLEALERGPRTLRPSIINSLAAIGDQRAIEPLIGRLQDDTVGTRAARALGEMGALQALEPMLDFAAESSHDYATEAVVKAVQQLGEAAIEPLIALVEDQTKPSGRRALAVLALKPFEDERARPVLLAAAQDSDERVRQAANKALFASTSN